MPRFSLGFRLLALFGGAAAMLASLVFIAAVAQYKPWGVKDHDREKYDSIVQQLALRQTALHQSQSQPTPRALVAPLIRNLGKIDPNQTVQSTFTVTNSGEGELTLAFKADTASNVKVDTETWTVAAGESAELSLDWTIPQSASGEQAETVVLQTNDPRRPELRLGLSGTVNVDWAFSDLPFRTRFISNSSKSEASDQPYVSRTILFSQVYDNTVVLKSECSSDAVSFEIEPASEEALRQLDAKSGVQVTVTHAPVAGVKKFHETVRLAVLDPSTESEKWVESAFAGRFKSPVSFYGNEIHLNEGIRLDTVTTDSDQEWNFFARFWTTDPPRAPAVINIYPDSLEATLEKVDRLKQTYRVTIRLKEDAKPEFFAMPTKQGYITIGDAENSEISNWMPLRGQIISPPR
tara:strand:+ start:988815 stop:990035 length:1221 start_codon:yes stop_codon:yes gene_type:complete